MDIAAGAGEHGVRFQLPSEVAGAGGVYGGLGGLLD